jgi:hypothetical protein
MSRKGLSIPIDRFIVTLRSHHFWSKVIGGSAKRPCNVWYVFGEAKIRNLDMAMSIQKEIFRLQIAVDDILVVQIF